MKKIDCIHKYGFKVELNIMLGLPFLSVKEQIEDTLNSIMWSNNHNCSSVVFPINIKTHTMIRYLYDRKLYKPISLWMVAYLLKELNHELLENITVAWYGNRDDSYENDIQTIYPQCCNKCRDKLASFFRSFLDSNQYNIRHNLIESLFETDDCDCFKLLVKEIEMCKANEFDIKYKEFYNLLQKDFGYIKKG